MIQKRQPAQSVKKYAKAKSHEKLSCRGDKLAPTTLKAMPSTPRSKDNPAKRLRSKYSPSGVGTTWERSLISLRPPVLLQVSFPLVCPDRRDVPAAHQPRSCSGCAAMRADNK